MRTIALPVFLAVLACGSSEPGVEAVIDLPAAAGSGHFFDHPFPSDLRLTADGTPDVSGYPNPTSSELLGNLVAVAGDRRGFSTQSTVYFRFNGRLAHRELGQVVLPGPGAPVMLIDVEPDSPERGRGYPVVLRPLEVEAQWAPEQVLAVAPVPGIILRGDTTYAVVVTRELETEDGRRLAASRALLDTAAGKAPAVAGGDRAGEVYAPLWDALEELDLEPADLAAATVFTTGDVVADLAELSDATIDRDPVTIEGLAVEVDGASHGRFCELVGTVNMPQYQAGTPPFNSGGLFEFGPDELPVVQRYEATPVVIAVPKTPMPAGGFPLMIYFHGSGGIAAQVIDRGRFDGSSQAAGQGPAYVVAEHGIGTVAASLPLSPDRLPGASAIEYLNFSNLAAFRDTFRQGVIESRLLLDATLALTIDPELVSECGLVLPDGATSFHFDGSGVVASGQSMGGMYTNLVTPVEPRIRAAVPTGAGGHWNRMILSTEVVPGGLDLVSLLIRTDPETISFVHPGLNLLSLAWESAEPFVFMPRIARRPLPGRRPAPIYQPVGQADEYFASEIYDAAALAYGNQLAGDQVWPGTARSLALAGLDTAAEYPVQKNLESETGEPYTGVVVQYPNDGIMTGHYIFAQLDQVKFQYGCFFATFLETGQAVVPQPSALGSKCPN